jgi:hypothetical protein
MAKGAGAAAPKATAMRARYDGHSAVSGCYAVWLTGMRACAADALSDQILRAWQYPQAVGEAERSPRGWLCTGRGHDNHRPSNPTQAARYWGDAMTALDPIRAPITVEYQMATGAWLSTNTAPRSASPNM